MSDITAIVDLESTYVFNATTNAVNPIDSIGNIANVDITTNGQIDGSVLVYKTTTNKWTATTTLSAQNMEGGEY